MRVTSSRPPMRHSSCWSTGSPRGIAPGSHSWVSMSVSRASGQGNSLTQATIKLQVGDQLEHTVSEGDGPVNALDGALRKALEQHYPRLREMHLADYKVRVINARAGTAARVRVVIESRDHESVWGTVGVSENIIEASWLALVDAFEYKLYRDARARDIEKTASAAEAPRRSSNPSRLFRMRGVNNHDGIQTQVRPCPADRGRILPLLRNIWPSASTISSAPSPPSRSGRNRFPSATAWATWSCT